MSQKITEQAILLCDKGAKPSQLKVSSQNFSFAEDKLIATEEDKQAETNIPNFGICSITKSKCCPNVQKWDNTTPKDEINGYKILTENSTCICTMGGNISIQNNGHEAQHEVG